MISVKTISRLENGERDSYPESTVGTVEALYQWSPGSIESVLMGGDPNPMLPTSPPARNPITSARRPADRRRAHRELGLRSDETTRTPGRCHP